MAPSKQGKRRNSRNTRSKEEPDVKSPGERNASKEDPAAKEAAAAAAAAAAGAAPVSVSAPAPVSGIYPVNASGRVELPVNTPEIKAALEKYIKRYCEVGVDGLMKEWDKKIRKYSPPGMGRTSYDANDKKNRYSDMPCNENTRIVLKDNKSGDYINANYVGGEPFANTFIATQGPLPNTVQDFWKMVVQENVSSIVMLCDITEKGKKKCEAYWPDKTGMSMSFGEVHVKNVPAMLEDTGIPSAEGASCMLEVTAPKGVKMLIKHHNWKGWPDHHVPTAKLVLVKLLGLLRVPGSVTVVHCSAGVGRTGTLLACELIMYEILQKKNGDVNMVEQVQKLRAMRMTSVQSATQYAYLIVVLGELAKINSALDPAALKALEKYNTDFAAACSKQQTGRAGGHTMV